MNTATQLLERCKTLLDKADFNDEESYQQSQLLCDIEAYLAKQQIAQEPVGYVERITGRLAYIGDAHREKFKNQYDALYASPQAREPMSEGYLAALKYQTALLKENLTK
jgi:hypothetical protein